MVFIVIAFIIIACMRVIQSIGNKRASNSLTSHTVFFHYATYYEIVMALFGLISLAVFGTGHLTTQTIVCSLLSAVLYAASAYASLNAMKGCKIIVVSLFSFGGLIISCLVSWVWFGETMSVFQMIGLAVFFAAMYLLSCPRKQHTLEPQDAPAQTPDAAQQADSQPQVESAQPEKAEKRINKKTWLLLFVLMLSEGLIMVAQKYFSLKVENGNIAWYSFFTFLFTAVFMACGLLITVLRQKKAAARKSEDGAVKVEKVKRLPKTLILCGIFLAFALFMINLLVTQLGKTLSSVLLFPTSSAISLTITTLVGWLVYKEKLSVKNFIGLLLGFIAIIIIAVFTPQMVQSFSA